MSRRVPVSSCCWLASQSLSSNSELQWTTSPINDVLMRVNSDKTQFTTSNSTRHIVVRRQTGLISSSVDSTSKFQTSPAVHCCVKFTEVENVTKHRAVITTLTIYYYPGVYWLHSNHESSAARWLSKLSDITLRYSVVYTYWLPLLSPWTRRMLVRWQKDGQFDFRCGAP